MKNNNYYFENRELILQYNINRYNVKIKSIGKIRCICDLNISYGSLKSHLSSKRHILYCKLDNFINK